jgi:hypothetical protein
MFSIFSSPAFRNIALLLPVTGPTAPQGFGSTGDPSSWAPLSFAGMPAIALPSGRQPARPPDEVPDTLLPRSMVREETLSKG